MQFFVFVFIFDVSSIFEFSLVFELFVDVGTFCFIGFIKFCVFIIRLMQVFEISADFRNVHHV